MTLEEAIVHAEAVADRCSVTDGNIKCEMEHRQLAEWLKELKERREQDLQPNCNKLATDTISRQEAIDAFGLSEKTRKYGGDHSGYDTMMLYEIQDVLEGLPSAQPEPSEITNEQAILHLQSTGWMQNHDREMYESGLREQLADDSGCYDSLIPCEDTINRQAAIDVAFNVFPDDEYFREQFVKGIEALPSAQPGITRREGCKYMMPDGERKTIYLDDAIGCLYNTLESYYIKRNLLELPSAQPETARRIVGKSRGGMTLWYQCDMCNEPVDAQDNFCRGCGRRLADG